MFKNLAAIVGALALIVVLNQVGLIARFNLSHPFWHVDATVLGASIGLGLAIVLFLLRSRSRVNAWRLGFVFAIVLLAAIFATWRAGNVFINSDNFEPLAGQVWFFGYHAMVALFVPVAAYFLRHLLPGK